MGRVSVFKRHPRFFVALQLLALAAFFGIVGWAIRGSLHGAADDLRNANLVEFGVGCAFLASYYLLFVLG
jgi:hypothetical protein